MAPSLIDAVGQAVIATDRAGHITYWNQAAEHLYGWTAAEVMGLPILEVTCSQPTREQAEAILECLRGGQAWTGEFLVQRRDGAVFPSLVTDTPIFDETGTVVGMVGVSSDITALKRVEEALWQSEARYRRIIETSQEGIWVIDPDQRTVFANQKLADMLGYDLDEMQGRELRSFLDEGEWGPADERLERRQTGVVEQHDVRYRRKDGTTLWVILSANPLYDDQGRYAGALAMLTDITARKHIEGSLSRAHRAMAAISGCHRAMVRATSEADLVQQVCQAIVDVGGYRLAWVGVPEEDAAKAVRLIARAGPDTAYLDNITITWDGGTAHGNGPAGRAIRSGRPWVIQKASTDPLFVAWRQANAAYGFASVIALPLIGGGRTLGVLALYAREADAFDQAEKDLLIELAEDLGFGIAALRAETERAWAAAALQGNEQRFRALTEHGRDLVSIMDSQGRFRYVSPAYTRLLGYTPEQLLGQSGSMILDPADCLVLSEAVAEDAAMGATTRPLHARVRHADGSWRVLELTVTNLLDDPIVAGYIYNCHDITERKRADDALRESEERYRRIVETAQEGIWQVDATGQTTYINKRMADLLGHTIDEVYQAPALDFVDDAYREMVREVTTWRHGSATAHFDIRYHHRSGVAVWGQVSANPLYDRQGQFLGTLAMVTDITQRKQAEEALRHQALHDALTGLPNRTLLRDRLEQALLVARRNATSVALLLLDLDRFKEVNDAFGHHHGDQLLQQAAHRLQQAVRGSDTVARLGGDEFAIVLPATDDHGALQAVHTLAAALGEPTAIGGRLLTMNGSIGIAVYPNHGDTGDTLLRHADVAMYVAKRRGEASAVYAPADDAYTPERMEMVAELRQAISDGGLQLYYQPKAALSGHLVGAEALVRWPHSRHGLLGPDHFIPLAEQTGLIGPLTMWVIEEAMRQGRLWRQGRLTIAIAVNLSTANLRDRALPEAIARLLGVYDLPANCLRVEVTESTLMADTTCARDVLGRIGELGIGVSVDDFGTGYSSLAYLKKLPVDELKIDKSFVQDMLKNPADGSIVASTISLAHSLGLRVVAEGVEDSPTWHTLARLGCDIAQGYYLGRPMPAAEMAAWARGRGAS